MKVFLGGTCNNTTWRERLIPMLKIDYFNPVVKNWTPKCQAEEIEQRETCDFCLYVITPKMTGFYSIAEVVDDSNKRPEKTIFCVLMADSSDDPDGDDLIFTPHQIKSLQAVKEMVYQNNAEVFSSLNEVADYVNSFVKEEK